MDATTGGDITNCASTIYLVNQTTSNEYKAHQACPTNVKVDNKIMRRENTFVILDDSDSGLNSIISDSNVESHATSNIDHSVEAIVISDDDSEARDEVHSLINANTTKWNQVVNDISSCNDICDQTEPTLLSVMSANETCNPIRKSRLTITEIPGWCAVSDTSFEAMERLTNSSNSTSSSISSNTAHCNDTAKANTDNGDVSEAQTIYGTANHSEKSDSSEDTKNDVFYTAQNTSVESGLSNIGCAKEIKNHHEINNLSYTCDALNENASSNDIQESINQNVSSDESREFNNTLEEMEYFLKYGDVSPVSKTAEKQLQSSIPKFTAITPNTSASKQLFNTYSDISCSTNSFNNTKSPLTTPDTSSSKRVFYPHSALPISQKTNSSLKKKSYFPKEVNSPLTQINIHQNKGRTCDRPLNFFKVPGTPSSHIVRPGQFNKLGSPLKNFKGIVSPIRTYLINSPQVPLFSAVKADKNLLHSKKLYKYESRVKNEELKENCNVINAPSALPVKAYKCSTFTNVTDATSPRSIGLSKNDILKKMIDANPQHTVIKHEGRLKDPLKANVSKTIINSEDSFANLTVSSADVSVYRAKDALHTNVLSKQK